MSKVVSFLKSKLFQDDAFILLLFLSALALFLPISPSKISDGVQVFVGFGISSSLVRVLFSKEFELLLPIVVLPLYFIFDVCIFLNRFNEGALSNKIVKVFGVIGFSILFIFIFLAFAYFSWTYYFSFVAYCFFLTVFSIIVTVFDTGDAVRAEGVSNFWKSKPETIKDISYCVFVLLVAGMLTVCICNEPMQHLYHAFIPLIIILSSAVGLLFARVFRGNYPKITSTFMYFVSFICLPIEHCFNANLYEVTANILFIAFPILQILCSLVFGSCEFKSEKPKEKISALSLINLLVSFVLLFVPLNSFQDVPSRVVGSLTIDNSISSFPALTIFEWETNMYFYKFPICSYVVLAYFMCSLAICVFSRIIGRKQSYIAQAVVGFMTALLCVLSIITGEDG